MEFIRSIYHALMLDLKTNLDFGIVPEIPNKGAPTNSNLFSGEYSKLVEIWYYSST